MAVKLRLRRMGKKRQPVYKVVAADARSPRDGRFIEAIGLYNPKTEPATIDINEERALYWLSVGAIPTITVKTLLRKKGILMRNQLIKKGLTEEVIEKKMAEWEKMQEAKLAAEKKVKQEAKKAEEKTEETKAEAEETKTEIENSENASEAESAVSEEPKDEKE